MLHAAGMSAAATTGTSPTMSLKQEVSVLRDGVLMEVMENLGTLEIGSVKARCHQQLRPQDEKVVANEATKDQDFDEARRLGAKDGLRMAHGRRAASSKSDRNALSDRSVRQQRQILTINGGQGCARMLPLLLLLLLLKNSATLHLLSRQLLLWLHDQS